MLLIVLYSALDSTLQCSLSSLRALLRALFTCEISSVTSSTEPLLSKGPFTGEAPHKEPLSREPLSKEPLSKEPLLSKGPFTKEPLSEEPLNQNI